MNLMKKFISSALIVLFVFSVQTTVADHLNMTDKPDNWKEQKISAEELVKWKFLGKGKVFNIFNEQTCLSEDEDSQGVMLMSPESYGDVVLKYKVLALTPATVLVTILSASDASDKNTLTIPSDYAGGMKLLNDDSRNYLLAYKNAPHGANPFILKNPGSAKSAYADQPDLMVAGIYYDVEITKSGKTISMRINGKEMVNMQDDSPLGKGNILFRIRGTAGLTASCLIRDLRILTPAN
jgi:hypothetical protein